MWRKKQYGGIQNMEEDTKWNKKHYCGKTQYGGIMEEDTIYVEVKQIWRNNGRRYNMEVKHKMEEYKFGGRNKMEE